MKVSKGIKRLEERMAFTHITEDIYAQENLRIILRWDARLAEQLHIKVFQSSKIFSKGKSLCGILQNKYSH